MYAVDDVFDVGNVDILLQSDGQFKKTACNDLLKKKNPDFKFTPMQEGLKQVRPSPYSSSRSPEVLFLRRLLHNIIDGIGFCSCSMGLL